MQLEFQGRFQIKEFPEFPIFNKNRRITRISEMLELQSFVVEFEIFVCDSARMVFVWRFCYVFDLFSWTLL